MKFSKDKKLTWRNGSKSVKVSDACKEFVQQLMAPEPTDRLGMQLSREDGSTLTDELQRHPWFASVTPESIADQLPDLSSMDVDVDSAGNPPVPQSWMDQLAGKILPAPHIPPPLKQPRQQLRSRSGRGSHDPPAADKEALKMFEF
eukprot:SAG22_NODE_183_length_16031_cov_36.647000_6_plen_146_part_00